MISTPYFDNLQKISIRTSKLRSQNNKLAHSLRRNGFSSYEINQITETESFITSRKYIRKTCSKCGVTKNKKLFIRPLDKKCSKCQKQYDKERYKSSFKLRLAKSKANKFYRNKVEILRRSYD